MLEMDILSLPSCLVKVKTGLNNGFKVKTGFFNIFTQFLTIFYVIISYNKKH